MQCWLRPNTLKLERQARPLMLLYYLLQKNIMYLHNRYFKLVMSMVLRCYCRYIIFIIIQHLCIGIETDKIRKQVHKAIHKENSWTSIKSTKYIKMINKIYLQHYCDIFWIQFFGMEFYKGNITMIWTRIFQDTERKNKRLKVAGLAGL